jgi:hypothetical protein
VEKATLLCTFDLLLPGRLLSTESSLPRSLAVTELGSGAIKGDSRSVLPPARFRFFPGDFCLLTGGKQLILRGKSIGHRFQNFNQLAAAAIP